MKYIIRLKEWKNNRWSYFSHVEKLDNGFEYWASEKFKFAYEFNSKEEALELLEKYNDNNFEVVDFETAYKDYCNLE